jgi:hypothetical protein
MLNTTTEPTWENLYADYWMHIVDAESHEVPKLLTRLYGNAMDIQNPGYLYPTFSKLCKMYGRDAVFYSILDTYDMEDLKNRERPYPILAYFCRRHVEEKTLPSPRLTETFDERLAKMKRAKMDFTNPLEENG